MVVGRESWGALYALFIPAGAEARGTVRQTRLDADRYGDAQMMLGELEQRELAELLERSIPKEG